jgi:NAD-dependent dihydropyrimidine dehydrogenase PreA subunit
MQRNVIAIDEAKCTGCGLCIPNCPEGAIQIIDGKARLVSDLMCDGLGACLGHCPEGAIRIEEREAAPYDERQVMANIIKAGPNTIRAHLAHLKEHNQTEYHAQAIAFLEEKGITVPGDPAPATERHHHRAQGCPGMQSTSFAPAADRAEPAHGGPSALSHWPVQLHLVSPAAPHYKDADLLLAADCTAFTFGDFHRRFLAGKTLAIACPKLDDGQEIYLEKLTAFIDDAKINTLTVAIMQVPCCGGLLRLAQQAAAQAARKIPVKCIVVGIRGEILKEEWV